MFSLPFRNPKLAVAIAKFGAGLAAAEKHFHKAEDREAIEKSTRTVIGKKWFNAVTPEASQKIWDNRGTGRALSLYMTTDIREDAFRAYCPSSGFLEPMAG